MFSIRNKIAVVRTTQTANKIKWYSYNRKSWFELSLSGEWTHECMHQFFHSIFSKFRFRYWTTCRYCCSTKTNSMYSFILFTNFGKMSFKHGKELRLKRLEGIFFFSNLHKNVRLWKKLVTYWLGWVGRVERFKKRISLV